MRKFIANIRESFRVRKIYRLCKRAEKAWKEVEQLMKESGLPSWKKKQIRRDMLRGNPTVLGE